MGASRAPGCFRAVKLPSRKVARARGSAEKVSNELFVRALVTRRAAAAPFSARSNAVRLIIRE